MDNLFIGDKLTRNELQSHDGTTFDVCNITSPIIGVTSTEDNISPPPQTLGWILDLYRDVDDIRTAGRTIVATLNHKIGHLALFDPPSRRGAGRGLRRLMDVIDCLSPGLDEMVIDRGRRICPRAASSPATGSPASSPVRSTTPRARPRSPEDDRAFAAVARLSE